MIDIVQICGNSTTGKLLGVITQKGMSVAEFNTCYRLFAIVISGDPYWNPDVLSKVLAEDAGDSDNYEKEYQAAIENLIKRGMACVIDKSRFDELDYRTNDGLLDRCSFELPPIGTVDLTDSGYSWIRAIQRDLLHMDASGHREERRGGHFFRWEYAETFERALTMIKWAKGNIFSKDVDIVENMPIAVKSWRWNQFEVLDSGYRGQLIQQAGKRL